jgi:hypothetical protein
VHEIEHHESGCLLGVVGCQSWPIRMVVCFPTLVAPELPAPNRPVPASSRMSASGTRPGTGLAEYVKSFGRRKHTKVSEERTRSWRTVAVGICVSVDRAGFGAVADGGTRVVGFPAAGAADRPFKHSAQVHWHRWSARTGHAVRRLVILMDRYQPEARQTMPDHGEARPDGVGGARGWKVRIRSETGPV